MLGKRLIFWISVGAFLGTARMLAAQLADPINDAWYAKSPVIVGLFGALLGSATAILQILVRGALGSGEWAYYVSWALAVPAAATLVLLPLTLSTGDWTSLAFVAVFGGLSGLGVAIYWRRIVGEPWLAPIFGRSDRSLRLMTRLMYAAVPLVLGSTVLCVDIALRRRSILVDSSGVVVWLRQAGYVMFGALAGWWFARRLRRIGEFDPTGPGHVSRMRPTYWVLFVVVCGAGIHQLLGPALPLSLGFSFLSSVFVTLLGMIAGDAAQMRISERSRDRCAA